MISLPHITIVNQIYESVNSSVYRGIINKNQQPVIVKLLKEDYPTPAELYRRYFSGLDDALLDSSESSKKGDVALSSDDFAAGVVPKCLPRQDCGATTGGAIAGGLPLQSDETIASDSIAAMTENIGETINYQLTAICL